MIRHFAANLTILLLTTANVKASNCSPTNYDIILKGGSSLPSDEIISRHNVSSSVVMLGCHTHCKEEEKCVGFNYRTTKDVENCQLTNVTNNRGNSKKGHWILMRDAEAVGGYNNPGKSCSTFLNGQKPHRWEMENTGLNWMKKN
ncbi:uncharacterized protein LOC114528944 [Dendronephthya gigantea]|uniref:uncharacterized protein LOC114528944 n=1 Tax=Dendronephthya gigantea TaxID=151771 RepID=UPI00106B8F62|nr:uncharacterized protein LOC114528944 [Dendronephthya gigantea]